MRKRPAKQSRSPASRAAGRLRARERELAAARAAVTVHAASRLPAHRVAITSLRAAVPVPRVLVLRAVRLVAEAAGRGAPLVAVRHEALAELSPRVRGARRGDASVARLILRRRFAGEHALLRLVSAQGGHEPAARRGTKRKEHATHHGYRK